MNNQKTSSYPTLTEMGIESPKQIDRFYITSINRVDVLRVLYDRPKTSFLSSSRSFKFPRAFEAAPDSTDKDDASVPRMHPVLRRALKELNAVIEAKATKENIAAEILDEFELLEEDIAIRSECLKVLVKKIPAVD